MSCREQHRWNGQYLRDPPLTQGIEAIAKDRPGEFQIAVFNRHRPQLRTQSVDHLGEFLHRQTVATAMATDQNAETIGLKVGQWGVPLFI